jgi:hypothetical protein
MGSDDDITSAGLIRRGWEFFPVSVNYLVIGLLLLGGLVFGIQQIAFQADNQNIKHTQQTQKSRNAIIQGNSNVQQGYISAIQTDVTAVDTNIIQAQDAPNRAMLISGAVAYGNEACLEASYLTGTYTMSAEMSSWISTNCSGGVLKVNSPIRSGQGN